MSADSNPTEAFADVDPDPDAVLDEFDVDSPDDLVDGATDDESRGVHEPTRDEELDVDDTTAAELFADLADAEPVADTDTESDGVDADTESDDERADPDPEDLAFEFDIEFVGDADATVRSGGDAIESSAAELSAVTEAEAETETETETETGTGTATEREPVSDTDSSVDDPNTADSSADRSTDPADAAADETTDSDATPSGADSPTDAPIDSSAPLTVRTDDGAELELVGEPTSTRVSNDAFGSAGADAR